MTNAVGVRDELVSGCAVHSQIAACACDPRVRCGHPLPAATLTRDSRQSPSQAEAHFGAPLRGRSGEPRMTSRPAPGGVRVRRDPSTPDGERSPFNGWQCGTQGVERRAFMEESRRRIGIGGPLNGVEFPVHPIPVQFQPVQDDISLARAEPCLTRPARPGLRFEPRRLRTVRGSAPARNRCGTSRLQSRENGCSPAAAPPPPTIGIGPAGDTSRRCRTVGGAFCDPPIARLQASGPRALNKIRSGMEVHSVRRWRLASRRVAFRLQSGRFRWHSSLHGQTIAAPDS